MDTTKTAEERAQQLISEAEKKLCPKGFLQSFFGSYKNRTEDAIDLYEKGGNLYKLAKNWQQASLAFKTAGELHLEQKNFSEAANDYFLAGKCLEKSDTNGAIKCLLTSIQIYTDMGRFMMAARLHNNIAEIYEQNLELEEAIEHYEHAADFYKVEDNCISAKKCLMKVAEYSSAEFQDYKKAINIFEEVAFYDLKTPILQYSVTDTLFKAVLCHVCVDILNAKLALDSYVKKHPDFQNSSQIQFLQNIIECLEESDEDEYTKICVEYNKLHRFDIWHTKILLKIRKQIKGPPSLL